MQTELNHTVNALFGKESLENLFREELHMMTVRYPYAAIFHFLYSRKLQALNDLRYPSSVAKTSLYFSNPHWLHHQLRERTSVEALAEMELAYENSHPISVSPTEITSDQAFMIEEDEIQPENVDIPEVKSEHENDQDFTLEDSETATEMEEMPLSDPRFVETTDNDISEEIVIAPVEVIQNETMAAEEPDLVSHKHYEEPADMGLIPIEPLYSIDYFASQGIRLREEDQQDPLGRKLKSFTEWLKSMKKIHPEKSKGQMDEKTEEVIKTEAELSNDRAEILTETMAEVLLKQGLKDKAIEVYEKLSLLDPAKSATFAAKISELKAVGI